MPDETRRHPCPSCRSMTNCKTVARERVDWDDKDAPVSGWDEYCILRCCGCDKVFFFHEEWFSEYQDPDPDAPEVTSKKYYPGTPKKVKPSNIYVIDLNEPSPIDLIHDEVYKAINEGLPQLAAAGIRTLVDRFAVSITGRNINFTANVKNLVKLGYITRHQFKILYAVLDVGGSVVHRSNIPIMEDVEKCLSIVELLMTVIRDLPRVAERLKSRTPQHPRENPVAPSHRKKRLTRHAPVERR